jgi:hypothetical protein
VFWRVQIPPAGWEEALDSKRVHSRPAERIWQAAEVPVMPVPMIAMRFFGAWVAILVRFCSVTCLGRFQADWTHG